MVLSSELFIRRDSSVMAEKDKEPEPERELTELEGLALKINEKSDETLESTRRMREMCAEAKDAGMKTLIALDDQEELIDKFEEAADGINHDMALAEKALKVGSLSKYFKHGKVQDTFCQRVEAEQSRRDQCFHQRYYSALICSAIKCLKQLE